MKRVLRVKCREGYLEAKYGRDSSGNVDICYCGDRPDQHLIHHYLGNKRPRLDNSGLDPSFLEELTARGYDLTTLRFSIQKMAVP